jgi:hypothetical protein
MKLIKLSRANNGKHKFTAFVQTPDLKIHKVLFGAKGYSDFTKHKDPERKRRYIIRHQRRENWSKKGALTPGFWSRWVLWNKPSLSESIKNVKRILK